MHNLMQDWPLRVTTIIDHAATYHANRPVIGRDHDGTIFTTTYSAIRAQALKLRQALEGLGIGRGDV
ncbi:MAG: long-chain fatty acid--CoA ligase, partial [Pseudomonadota bacterium]